jgi:hypothetical protein
LIEVDVAAFAKERPHSPRARPTWPVEQGGGTATAVWAPALPTRTVETDLPDTDEYEVRVYDTKRGRQLVAMVEIVSPANKDRPEHRRAFIAKCAALLQKRIAVAIVDFVTTRRANLYADLLDFIGQGFASPGAEADLYAVACRYVPHGEHWRFETWEQPLALGQVLPTLPLWLTEDLAVPLELEASYEETCKVLLIP